MGSTSSQPLQKKQRRSQKERSEESEQRMLDAAQTLLLQHGSRATSLNQVGELAGYSRGLASYKFGTKEKMFQALLDRIQQDWAQHYREVTDRVSGIDKLYSSLDAYVDFVTSNPDRYRALSLLRHDYLSGGTQYQGFLSKTVDTQRASVERWIQEAIELGQISGDLDIQKFSLTYCSFFYGTMYLFLLSGDPETVTESVSGFRRLLKDAFGASLN